MVATTYGDISPRTGAYAYMMMLRHVIPTQVLNKLGQVKAIPKNKTTVVKFRRAIPYDPVTSPLQEGVTPSPKGTRFEDVTVNLQQWGDVHDLTDVIADTHEDPVLDTMMQLSGEQAGGTTEQVTYGVLKGGTSVYYANGVARSAVNTPLSLNKQRAVVRTLMRNKGRKFTTIVKGSINIGTEPVEAAFVAVGHTDLAPDIRNMNGFVPVSKYGTMKPMCAEEIGAVEDVRYILSPDLEPFADAGGSPGGTVLSTTGANADVYPLLVLAKDAFGITPLKNQKIDGSNNLAVQPIVLNPGKATKSDPLGQRGYVGWKAWFNAVRLNETWMVRLEVAASSL